MRNVSCDKFRLHLAEPSKMDTEHTYYQDETDYKTFAASSICIEISTLSITLQREAWEEHFSRLPLRLAEESPKFPNFYLATGI